MSISQCNILGIPDTLSQWEHIRFWLSIPGNSSENSHCGNAVNMPYWWKHLSLCGEVVSITGPKQYMFLYFWLFQSYERLKSIERNLIDVLIIAATNILNFSIHRFNNYVMVCYHHIIHNMLFAYAGYQQSARSIHNESIDRGTEGQSGHIACSV